MNPLKKAAQDYVALRRSLGFKLRWVPNLLADFVSFLKEQGANHITVPLALQWAQRNPENQACHSGLPVERSPWFCPLQERHRPTHANPAVGLGALPVQACTPILVHG